MLGIVGGTTLRRVGRDGTRGSLGRGCERCPTFDDLGHRFSSSRERGGIAQPVQARGSIDGEFTHAEVYGCD